jgi:hypothetical protein
MLHILYTSQQKTNKVKENNKKYHHTKNLNNNKGTLTLILISVFILILNLIIFATSF